MKKHLFISAIALIVTFTNGSAQNIQLAVGATGSTHSFTDVKFDQTGGRVINVGSLNTGGGNGNDLSIVRLSPTRQILWQKTFANAGNDVFYRVIVCANGDYVAAGQIFNAGVRRGIICRFDSADGSLIWATQSLNAFNGEFFWDVTELANGNIAAVGTDRFFTGQTNSSVTVLSPTGAVVWASIYSAPAADEFRNVIQLANGNLFVVGFYTIASNYGATLTELSSTNGTLVSQSTYEIGTSVPGGIFLNSLYGINVHQITDTILLNIAAFQGFGTFGQQCVLTLDPTTKTLSGNIYYHSNIGIVGYGFYPFSLRDFILSATEGGNVYVSRVTNGSVVSDQLVNSTASVIAEMDVTGANVVFCGNATAAPQDGFNFFTTTNLPSSTTPCDVSPVNTLTLQPLTLTASNTPVVTFVGNAFVTAVTPVFTDPTNTVTDVCGLILPVNLLSFSAKLQPSNSVLLNWQISQEINLANYDIERSIDGGRTFAKIGSLNATNAQNYDWTDIAPVIGTNLYRLKNVDRDGRFDYSKTVEVEIKANGADIYSATPNPTSGLIAIRSLDPSGSVTSIQVIDAAGRIVKMQRGTLSADNPLMLDLSALNAGTYYVKISAPTKPIVTKKIVLL